MSGLIGILNIGRRALLAQEFGLAVIGNNIANANTRGYTRQEVVLEPDGVRVPGLGGVGTGVNIVGVQRARDLFADQQFRRENQALGYWKAQADNLSSLESLFNDLDTSALADDLNDFWTGWQSLADQPEDLLARESVVERGRILADSISALATGLATQRRSLDAAIADRTNQLNDLAGRVAMLNERVVAAQGNAPDLQDERDRLIDEMTLLANVTASTDASGALVVRLGGRALVAGTQALPLEMREGATPGASEHGPVWAHDGSAADVRGGEIAGLMELRDRALPEMQERLDRLAWAVASEVNRLHRGGTDATGAGGGEFFVLPPGADELDPTGAAAALKVSPDLLADPRRVAAGRNGSPGDNANALALAALAGTRIDGLGGATTQEYWAALAGYVGAQVSEASDRQLEHQAALEQFLNLRDASEGVSLDEEAARMIAYQQAYAAAARVISVADEMARDLMNVL